jgi:hypothetical protein
MRLFVNHKGRRLYLKSQASSRMQFSREIGSHWFSVDGIHYSVNQVQAEPTPGSTVAGALLGGVVGLIAGPIGVISGATLGGIIGNKSDESEQIKVRNFNNSSAQL